MSKLTLKDNLFILPFDHFSAFTDLLGVEGENLSESVNQQIADLKMVVYKGFLKSWELGIPREESAIIVDELFGGPVLQTAFSDGVAVCLGVEKHNTEEFDFFYGSDWVSNINRLKPAVVKALLKYNTLDSLDLKQRQAAKLKQLSDWCKNQDYIFMLEPLIPPKPEQLELVHGDRLKYDQTIRPTIAEGMLKELYDFGVKPDIWKLEGYDKADSCQRLFEIARQWGGPTTNIIMLGRNQPLPLVESQLQAAALGNWFGFAVGRTVFYEPLRQYVKDGHLTKAVSSIADNFYHLYRVFKNN